MNRCMAARIAFLVILLGSFAAGQHAAAQTYWQGTTGDWFDPANWDSSVPTADDTAYISNGGTAEITTGVAEPRNLVLDGSWESSHAVLGDGGRLSTGGLYIGWTGTGRFVQTGGLSAARELSLGTYGSNSHGTYELSGTSQLTVRGIAYIGVWGTGHFIQTGGRHKVGGDLIVAKVPRSSGTYKLGGDGRLSSSRAIIGSRGSGQFIHTIGTYSIERDLILGAGNGGKGRYELGDGGMLSASVEYIGGQGTGQFLQTGGKNTTGYLSINSLSRYELSGGKLEITGDGLNVEGVLDFSGGDGRIQVGDDAIVNLSGGVLGSAKSKLTVGANSLTIHAPGAHPADTFGRFATKGMLHEAGQVLDVHAGEGFAGRGRIDDHVVCQGTITATQWQAINMHDGLVVSAGGAVDLGEGTLRVNDTVSGLAGSSLSARYEYIGDTSTGSFSHTAGTNTIKGDLYLGYSAGANGTYELSGDGALLAGGTHVGHEGTGVFRQTGGVHNTGGLVLGRQSGTEGTYELSGDGQLSAWGERIGESGNGIFYQTGGTNKVKTRLFMGYEPGSHGTYSISGGSLEAGEVYVGWGGGGELNILNSDASITVAGGLLRFGTHSVLTAVEGSTINMNRAKFKNRSTNPAALAGLSNLALVFEGRARDNRFEVAGEDMGVSLVGFDLNFALGTLQVGSGGVRGVLQLVDNFDNQPGWVGDEALYVENLIIEGVGSSIDLNGLNLYYLNGGDLKQLFHADANLDGVVDIVDLTSLAASWSFLSPGDKEWSQGDTNGDMLIDIVDLTALAANWGAETIVIPSGPVPEPGCLALMAAGGLVLLQRRRKRQSP